MSAAPPTARDVALQVVRDVFGEQHRGAREALDYRLRRSELDTRDRAFATELAYGAIKMRRFLDFSLEPYVGSRDKLPQAIAEILRLGAYQLRGMNGVAPHAAVSESVGLARKYGHKGTAGLVNAVLRRVAEDPPRDGADLATRASLPTWVVEHWRKRFGDEQLAAILDGVNAPAPVGLCIDERRVSRDEALAALHDAGCEAAASVFARDEIVLDPASASGQVDTLGAQRWHLHAEAAAFAVDILDPQPGMRVADLCCGRGNKTLQIASRTRDEGSLLAVDADEKKTDQAAKRAEAAEIRSVAFVTADVAEMQGLPDADAVLLDAPCSGLGILGRQPEARWRKRPDDPARLAPLQRKLLASAARCVKPGGVLVYAVCSTDAREAEEIVDAFLAETPAFARDAVPERYGAFLTGDGDVLVPPGIGGRDGFYVARVRRSA